MKKIDKNYHAKLLIKLLKKRYSFSAVKQNLVPPVVPKGIARTTDETINLISTYWKENATVLNAGTSQPATISIKTVENVNMSADNIVLSETPVIKLVQYEHSYMVQNATDRGMFRSFQKEHTHIKIGFATFRKLKSFYVSHWI